eukprot:scaffold174172_cov56-Attheya_sp.AAC.2
MVPEERRLASALSRWWDRHVESMASEIARLGMTDAIRSQADASMARSDAREFLEKKKKREEKKEYQEWKEEFQARREESSGKENSENSGSLEKENLVEKVGEGGKREDRVPS